MDERQKGLRQKLLVDKANEFETLCLLVGAPYVLVVQVGDYSKGVAPVYGSSNTTGSCRTLREMVLVMDRGVNLGEAIDAMEKAGGDLDKAIALLNQKEKK